MKKIVIILSLFLFLLLVTGCGADMNTPTGKVEEFLGKYQMMDSEVLTQLDNVISNDVTMNDEQKKDYKSLMEKQYQNLSYKIKEEEIDGNTASVLVEIEVYDYANSIVESREYYNDHKDEFQNGDNGNAGSNNGVTDNNDEVEDRSENNNESLGEMIEDVVDYAFADYKIKQLKDVTDKAKYEITFHLQKENGEWKIEDLSDVDRQKIHGLFEG